MAVTITNHLIRSADTPHAAEFGDGGWTVTWLPSLVLTEGQAAMEIEAASQIPAGCDLGVYDEEFWSRVDAWAWPARSYRTRRHGAGIRGGRGRVAWPVAGYGVVAAGGLGGDEDEQA